MLAKEARFPRARRYQEARKTLELIAEQGGQPELQELAQTSLAKIDKPPASAPVDMWNLDTIAEMDPTLKRIREQLRLHDQGEIQLPSDVEQLARKILHGVETRCLEEGFKVLVRQLKEYATDHEGRLPQSIDVLQPGPPDLLKEQLLYFPTGNLKADELPDEIILAITTRPLGIAGLGGGYVLVLIGMDEQPHKLYRSPSERVWPRVTTFAEAWQRSQTSREKAGLPPVPDSELKELVSWLQPATRPGSGPAK